MKIHTALFLAASLLLSACQTATTSGTFTSSLSVAPAKSNLSAQQDRLRQAALEYLLNDGWEFVVVGPTRKIKTSEYSYFEEEVIAIGNIGIMKETKIYKAGTFGSLRSLREGVSLAKSGGMFALEVIDSNGVAQELKELNSW